jgi:hypothetical protein
MIQVTDMVTVKPSAALLGVALGVFLAGGLEADA